MKMLCKIGIHQWVNFSRSYHTYLMRGLENGKQCKVCDKTEYTVK